MLSIGQKVYYTRILEPVGIYELLELRLRTVEEDFFVGTEDRTKHAFLFGKSALNKTVFLDRNVALKIVREAEKNKKEISKEVYYEEY